MDFTLKTYNNLLMALKIEKYNFQTFSDFIEMPLKKIVILRHDVDLSPQNSLIFAKIQHSNGIKGTYYFRAIPESWDEHIITKISEMGHEIGYHYENLTTHKGDIDKAFNDFCLNLERLRKLANVRTICMHGSPRSPFDSKDIWGKYDYKSLGLIGEPYLDIDFKTILYLSDTGRRWDGYNVSVRDKIPDHQERWNNEGFTFHSTNEIISNIGVLPDKIMFTFHPQRWHDLNQLWVKELIFQNIKNEIKWFKLMSK